MDLLARALTKLGHYTETLDLTSCKGVVDAKEMLSEAISHAVSESGREVVLIGHSAGGQLVSHFIDDGRVKFVVSLCGPSHNPLDYPWMLWPIFSNFGYLSKCLLGSKLWLKEEDRRDLFGGEVHHNQKAYTYGHLALQITFGWLLGNRASKVNTFRKFLAVACKGDKTVTSKSVRKTAKRCQGFYKELDHGDHYPQIGVTNNSIPAILEAIESVKPGLIRPIQPQA